jgi:hypothetical protein
MSAAVTGPVTQKLRANDSYQVQGLTKEADKVPAIRDAIYKAGVSGAVAVSEWNGQHLPYIENYVNLLVIEDAAAVAKEEIDRVLTPLGVAMIKKGGAWEKITKAWPKDMDEWTHYAYDSKGNPTSKDMLVGPPSRMQWVGNPRWSRHHDRMSSVSAKVSAGGRIYYIIDEGSRISILMPAKFMLIARDAFNGTVLWKKPIPEWSTHLWPLKSGPTQLTRRIVAMGDKVYVTMGITDPDFLLRWRHRRTRPRVSADERHGGNHHAQRHDLRPREQGSLALEPGVRREGAERSAACHHGVQLGWQTEAPARCRCRERQDLVGAGGPHRAGHAGASMTNAWSITMATASPLAM